jgi:Tat protein translocase TatB subunit
MFDVGGGELLLILVVVVVLFGPKQLPDLARKLGHFTKTIRNTTRELKKEFDDAMKD